jgi:tRNA threonylcarbamoyladenosine modification (KEOPS) complex Cgi121 subunit
MIDEIDGYHLLTLGFEKAHIANPETTLRQLRSTSKDVQVQLLKAGLIAGPEHLRFAARNALHSFNGKNPRSKSLAVEYLLYISCQRQISKAIGFLGVEPSDSTIALVGLSESREQLSNLEKTSRTLLGVENSEVLEIDSKRKLADIQKAYGISEAEMNAARFEGESDPDVLKRLIIERSALLSIPD